MIRTYGGPDFSFTYLLFIKHLLRIMVFLVQGTDRENIEKKKKKKKKKKRKENRQKKNIHKYEKKEKRRIQVK